MKRNKRLLLKAAKRIEEIPQSYDQKTFARVEAAAPCGTAGCLAGEIIICSERSVKKGVEKLNKVVRDWNSGDVWPGEVAGKLVGLNDMEQTNLFASEKGSNWPVRFRRNSVKGRAKTAPQLLRYLADGGKL